VQIAIEDKLFSCNNMWCSTLDKKKKKEEKEEKTRECLPCLTRLPLSDEHNTHMT
jgi:hypothetical protein